MKVSPFAVVGGANLVFLAGLAYLWHAPERYRWTEPAPIPPVIDAVALAGAGQAADVSRFRETVSRPLFSAKRRPAPPSPSPDEANAEISSTKDMRLLGLYGAGDRGGAIVQFAGKVQRVRFGEQIGGWTIASADGRTVTLTRGGAARQNLEMPLAASVATVSSAVAKAAESPAATQPAPTAASAPAQSRANSYEWTQSDYEAYKQTERDAAAYANADRARRGLPPLFKVD